MLWVICNPFAGNKQSIHLWQFKIQPLLKDAGLDHFQLLKTEHPGHAQSWVTKHLTVEIDKIMILGGMFYYLLKNKAMDWFMR